MKEKLRNLFDEMKVRSRYKSMNAIIDMIEPPATIENVPSFIWWDICFFINPYLDIV